MFDSIRRLLGTRTAKSGLSFASSGLSFALANLILASALPVDNYATVALLVAIIMFASYMGMFGTDGVVNRHPVTPDPQIFRRVALTSAIAAILAAFFAIGVYQIPANLAALLVPTIVAFSITRFCGAYLQSRLRFMSSLVLVNSLNYLLLTVALLSLIADVDDTATLFRLIMILQSITAVVAVILVRSQYKALSSSYVYSWTESLAYIFMASSSTMLVQLERLLTPKVLELDDLAILGVLFAIVGPPFRLLYLTLGYNLLPRLRKTKSKAERIAILTRHSILALLMILSIWIVIWFGAPLIQTVILSDHYSMSGALILATLVAGTIKALSGIAEASVTALSSVKGMQIMGSIGWASIIISVGAAWYGSQFGLAGVVYGVGVGWLIRSLAASVIVAGQLDDTNPIAEETMRLQTLSADLFDDRRP